MTNTESPRPGGVVIAVTIGMLALIIVLGLLGAFSDAQPEADAAPAAQPALELVDLGVWVDDDNWDTPEDIQGCLMDMGYKTLPGGAGLHTGPGHLEVIQADIDRCGSLV